MGKQKINGCTRRFGFYLIVASAAFVGMGALPSLKIKRFNPFIPPRKIMKKIITIGRSLFLSLIVWSEGPLLHAAGSNAMDRIDFGNTVSETAHAFNVGFSSQPLVGTGAMGQTYRAAYGGSATSTNNQLLQFTMTVDPVKQNYLTVRVWGSDLVATRVWLLGANYGGYSSLVYTGGAAPFPNRFHYGTLPIPLSMTQGKTSVQLQLVEDGSATLPQRPIYSAYTHTEPMFLPDGNDPTGSQLPITGQAALGTLTAASATSILQANRQAIYGSGGYYDSLLARQIMPGQVGAPVETVGLDLWTNVANWARANPSALPDQWRDQCCHTHGPGYSCNPDELMSVLVSTYFLPPFKDANNNIVTGLDHYQDPTIITRIVAALDGCTYMYGVDGSFQEHGGAWCGLTSTPRATGHVWAGTTARNGPWSISLEGCDTATIGYTIIRLLNDATAAPLFKNYLDQTYDANLNGTSVLRATAYEQMLYNHLNYLKVNLGAGTESQGQMDVVGLYATQIALAKLQLLYPNVSYPALSDAAGISFATQIQGVAPVTSQMGRLYTTAGANYGISKKGFGEAHGTMSSGYDGRYGTIVPWLAVEIAELASLDPAMDFTTLVGIRNQARATIDGFSQFISAQENFMGTSNEFTLAQEDYITYRNAYGPGADSGGFMVGVAAYQAADPGLSINSSFAQRAVYLETQYGVTPGFGAGGGDQLQYLRWLPSYEASIRSLINVTPSSLTAFPGEPGRPNYGWIDPQTGTTALYYNGERFYMNANWDNYETSGNKYGVASNLARIHDTTSTIDRADLVYMPYDMTTVQSDANLSGAFGQSWVVRYGNWLIAGNPTTSSFTLQLPPGNGKAKEVVADKSYTMGSSVTISAGQGVALWMPMATSSQPIANGTYTMSNVSSNLLLDNNGSTSSGAQMVQNSASGSNSQQWTFTFNGGGYYTIKNMASGMYLTDPSGSSANGAKLQQKPADNADDQLWQLISNGNGYVIVNKAGGTDINDPAASLTQGLGIILWAQDAGNNSVWILDNTAPDLSLPNGTYTMSAASSFLMLDSNGAILNAQMIQNTSNGADTQKWTFVSNGNGYYTIKNVASGLYLTDPSGSNNGAKLVQQAANGNDNQLWSLIPNSGGYVIVNKAGGIDIDVPGGSATAGTKIDLWTWGGLRNQIWILQ